VPVVNENDTVAVDEIRFGDNDSLAALVATMVNADLVLLLSDIADCTTPIRASRRRRRCSSRSTSLPATCWRRPAEAVVTLAAAAWPPSSTLQTCS